MEILTRALDPLIVGPGHTHGGLTLFPIRGAAATERAYRTLDEALAGGVARVSEVSSAGSVPELCFVNDGDRPILLLDGEELVGAKQNRVLNLTILVPAGKTVVIPVSCVEAGRWASVSRNFNSSKQVLYARARGRSFGDVSRSLSTSGRRMSNQGRVWRDVERLAARYGVNSPTSKMTDVFEARDRDLDGFVGHFEPAETQVGAVFAVNGRVEGVEIFDHPEVLAALLPKLIRSWALDVLAQGESPADPPAQDQAQAFFDRVRQADTRSYDAVGAGLDIRLASKGLAGGALVHDDALVHLCAFRVEEAESGGGGENGSKTPPRGRVEPASRRRARRGWFGFGRN